MAGSELNGSTGNDAAGWIDARRGSGTHKGGYFGVVRFAVQSAGIVRKEV